jgi:hypothetical protein
VKIDFVNWLNQTPAPDFTPAPTSRAIIKVSPAAEAKEVPLEPVFQWEPVMDAIGYHIQIADNPSFRSPLADVMTQDTFYTLTVELKPGDRYYWRVQPLFNDQVSNYVSNAFTTLNLILSNTPDSF